MNEITPKPLSDIERQMYTKGAKVNAGISLPPPMPPESPENAVETVLALVSEGYAVTEICAVEGFPRAGEFMALCEADPELKAKLKHALKIRGLVLREARLVNARAENKTSAYEMVARDLHIVDAPETNPAAKVDVTSGGGAIKTVNIVVPESWAGGIFDDPA